ncbi:ribonucleoside-triphosphate reductase, adenosylcobalamin-dependent, partial [Lactobacillus crispatus]|nr:ribonucleoside-triphosphate reductase, adenosylcobalamin-dependent [Lactobacillus crispatus]
IKAANADSDNFASAGTVSIAEQFATQAFLQTYWSDNAVSCTITFQNDESDQIAPLLHQYRYAIKSTSLLPYYGGSLKQAPKEPISKEKYEKADNH